MALAHDEERFHTCLMKPGKIGLEISPQGEVLSVKPEASNQAKTLSLKVGWRVHSVEGEPYSREKLRSFVLGRKSYTVIFAETVKAHASAPAAPQGGYPAAELMAGASLPLAPKGGYSAAEPEEKAKEKAVSFKLTKGSCTKDIKLYKGYQRIYLRSKVGDLRAAVQDVFEIVPFEQKLTFKSADGDFVEIKADDSVPLSEVGLVGGEEFYLAKQVDRRFKMEKETALLEALAACRFRTALQVLRSSGVKVSPDCVHTYRGYQGEDFDPNWPDGTPREFTNDWCNEGAFAFGEHPCAYTYPALTVAMIAGTPRGGGHPAVSDDGILKAARQHVAREPQVVEVVKQLLEMRADVNATGEESHDGGSWPRSSPQGKTPLCAAVQRGSPKLVRLLLEAGADPNHTVTMGSRSLVPADFIKRVMLDAESERLKGDPRAIHKKEIFALLKAASERSKDVEASEVAGA